nr:amidase [Hyphomonas sp. Mor2]
MQTSEYSEYDGLGLADLVRRKDVSATELVNCAIELAEKHDPVLNALMYKAYDQAREEAKSTDAGTGRYGPFAGVPFLLKDYGGDREGWPSTMSLSFRKDNVAQHTDTLTERFLNSGTIPIGQTTVPEMALIPITESNAYGDTLNPWDTSRTPGGSSGGSAAFVAAGVVPMAHANDGGGSIRIPASCCGLVGHKPSRGLTPAGPVAGEVAYGMGINHIVSRTVRDTAAMLDCVSGPGIGDPYGTPKPASTYISALDHPPKRLKIAYYSDHWVKPGAMHPECKIAADNAAKLLSGLGHDVEEKLPAVSLERLMTGMRIVGLAVVGAGFEAIKQAEGGALSEDMFEPFSWKMYEYSQRVTGPQVLHSQETLRQVAREMGQFHEDYDVLVTPCVSSPPIKIGEYSRVTGAQLHEGDEKYDMWYISGFQNATGQPSISLPLHQTKDGLPVGVMLTAGFGKDDLLLSLAGELERAAPWIQNRPPVWA